MDASGLAAIDLFADCSGDELERLAEVLSTEEHPVGAVLVEEGDLPTKFFVILDGNVTVHRAGRHVADLGPGDFFGELGVLALQRRNATVIATTPLRVAVAMGWDLRRVLEEAPGLGERLGSIASSRVSQD